MERLKKAIADAKIFIEQGKLPPKDSNWHGFAKAFKVGWRELDDLAKAMDYKTYDILDASTDPKDLLGKEKRRFINALKMISSKATGMSDSEIERIINKLII
jgi:hypothetical protein